MKGKTVAILEARAGDRMADLVRKYGGTPLSAPALTEIPDVDPAQLAKSLKDWDSKPPDIFIFQTGVGAKALFAATDALGLTNKFLHRLDAAWVVARGPKPTAVLRSRAVRIDAGADEPFTTAEVLAQLTPDLRGKRVAVQRYGETNSSLHEALEQRGAQVIEIATYRWGLPDNIEPLTKLIDALERGEVHAVAFTSASQVVNLFTVAHRTGKLESLKSGLGRTVVASIGPVCTAALGRFGIEAAVEPHPPKLGPFISALNDALSKA